MTWRGQNLCKEFCVLFCIQNSASHHHLYWDLRVDSSARGRLLALGWNSRTMSALDSVRRLSCCTTLQGRTGEPRVVEREDTGLCGKGGQILLSKNCPQNCVVLRERRTMSWGWLTPLVLMSRFYLDPSWSLDWSRGWRWNSCALSFSLAGEGDRHVRAWELGEERWERMAGKVFPGGGAEEPVWRAGEGYHWFLKTFEGCIQWKMGSASCTVLHTGHIMPVNREWKCLTKPLRTLLFSTALPKASPDSTWTNFAFWDLT